MSHCPKCRAPTGTPHKYAICLPIHERKVLTPEQLMEKKEKLINKRQKVLKEINVGKRGTIRELRNKEKVLDAKISAYDSRILHSVKHQYDMSKFNIIANRLNEDVAGLIMRFLE